MSSFSLVAIGSFTLLALGWFVYPLCMSMIASLTRRASAALVDAPQSHSILIATRDDPAIVAGRVRNALEGAAQLPDTELIVAVDVTSKFSIEQYASALDPRAIIMRGDQPGGKAATLNAAVRAARGSLLVFTDSQQSFLPGALTALSQCFTVARIGAVSGTLQLGDAKRERNVLDLFWNYELSLRRNEAAVHSIVAVTGAIYAMRKTLWTPLPDGLICDDLFAPMQVIRQGWRVGVSETALAVDPRKFTRSQEFSRKVRTLTGMLQLCALLPWVLLPWRNPVWVQFVCHKLMRLATPYLLIIGALCLIPSLWPLIRILWLPALIGGALLCGLAYLIAPAKSRQLVSQLVWALQLLSTPLIACRNALRGNWNVWH